jgi:putative transposase
MKRSRFSDEHIIAIVKEEAGPRRCDLPQVEVEIYPSLEASEAKRLRALENENARLKRLLADALLDNAALKKIAGKLRRSRSKPTWWYLDAIVVRIGGRHMDLWRGVEL